MTTITNMIKKIKAKLGFHGVSDSDVLKAGNTAYDGLLNNAAYPNPPVPLPTFRQALDSFNALIVDAEDGGKKSISAKNKQRPVDITGLRWKCLPPLPPIEVRTH